MKTMTVSRVGFIPTVDSRLVLLAGFGGLLILMAFAGVDGIQALQQIQTSNDRIRDEFLLRTQVLERIRSDLYLSGTDVRDYLLEPQAGKADGHRYTLLETRKDMDAALQQYLQLLSRGEAQPFRVLTEQLAAYWSVLEPTFEWTAEQRQRAGYAFLRDEVFPRRTSRRIAKLENQAGISDRTPGILLLVCQAGTTKADMDPDLQILRDRGFLPTGPGVASVDFGRIPGGLNAEERENVLRERGWDICFPQDEARTSELVRRC